MAEVPIDAGFSLSRAPCEETIATVQEIVLSLEDPATFSAGILHLPILRDDTGSVLLIEEDLTVAAPDAIYRVPGFWPALEADDLKSIALLDGSTFAAIDFIETFGAPDLLDELFYSIETAALNNASLDRADIDKAAMVDDESWAGFDGILDMRDLGEPDPDVLMPSSNLNSDPVSTSHMAFEISLRMDASLHRLFTESELDLGG